MDLVDLDDFDALLLNEEVKLTPLHSIPGVFSGEEKSNVVVCQF